MKYNFYVRQGSEVDIPRILAETPDDRDVVLVVSDNAIVFIREAFLMKFCDEDTVGVLGEDLSHDWGFSTCSADNKNRSGIHFDSHISNTPLLGFRCRSLPKQAIERLVQDLTAARAYVPRREVRVSYL